MSSNVGQVLRYAFHEGTDICVLTTGLKWWLYLPREKGQPEERRFAVLDIHSDPVEQLADDLERFLGKRSLETGDAFAQAERVLAAQRERVLLIEKIPDIWRKMVEEPDEELLELISKRVYNEVNLRLGREQVVAVLKGQPALITPAAPPTTVEESDAVSQPDPTPDQKPTPSPPAPQKRDIPGSSRPTSFVVFGTSYPIESNSKGLTKLLEVLYQRDPVGFSKLTELKGHKYRYISQDRAELRKYSEEREVGSSGYLVDTNLGTAQTWERARVFMRHLGYEDSDLELRHD